MANSHAAFKLVLKTFCPFLGRKFQQYETLVHILSKYSWPKNIFRITTMDWLQSRFSLFRNCQVKLTFEKQFVPSYPRLRTHNQVIFTRQCALLKTLHADEAAINFAQDSITLKYSGLAGLAPFNIGLNML